MSMTPTEPTEQAIARVLEPTPRTEDHLMMADVSDHSSTCIWEYVVPTDFARTLERETIRLATELSNAREALRVAREKIEFVLDECDWEKGDSDQPFGGGDERIGPSLRTALARIDAALPEGQG